MWELAAKDHFSALIVFAEHRFEGESVPDYSLLEGGCFTYLTSSQALADFASLISHLSPKHDRPVIAFGGSYGGMLSSWMRMKYPGSVVGAIASSAPVFGLPLTMSGDMTTKEKGGMPNKGTMDGAFHVVGDAVRLPKPDFFKGSTSSSSSPTDEPNHCFDNLLATWPLIQYYGQTREGRDVLSQEFDLCHPIKNMEDAATLIEWAQSPWFDLAGK